MARAISRAKPLRSFDPLQRGSPFHRILAEKTPPGPSRKDHATAINLEGLNGVTLKPLQLALACERRRPNFVRTPRLHPGSLLDQSLYESALHARPTRRYNPRMTHTNAPTLTPVSFKQAATGPDGFAQALGRSFQDTGFAIVSDHPVDLTVINTALDDTKAFFALPEATKRAYFDPSKGGQRGYTPFATENPKGQTEKDLKEFWHLGRDLPAESPHRAVMPDNISVSEVANFDASTRALYKALDDMGAVLLRAIAKYLGLEENWFDNTVDHGNSVLRLLHYPPIEGTPSGVRAGAHEDINVITLLLGAEEAGLQAKTRDGQWMDVQPPEGALVINVGDMLQRLTNNVLPSTTHRVINPNSERMSFSRYSTPFFLHFNPDFVIETLPGCISDDNPNRYPDPLSSHDYLQERLREIGLI